MSRQTFDPAAAFDYDPTAAGYGSLLSGAWAEARARIGALSADPCARFAEWRGREVEFAREVLGERGLWAAPRAQIESFFRNRFTTIRASRRASKTYTNALCIVIAVNLYECTLISLSSSERQVKDQLWQNVAKLYQQARRRGVPLIGKLDTTQLVVGPQHYAVGFSTNRPDRAQGAHAGAEPPIDDPDRDLTDEELEAIRTAAERGDGDTRKLFYILDEAAGIEQPILDAVIGSTGSPNVHLMMTANPTRDYDDDHEFCRSFRPGSGYHRIKIAPIETPDPVEYDEAFLRVPNWLIEPAAGEELGFVESARRRWGEDSPLFAAYVAGNFASDQASSQVIPLSLLLEALDRKVHAAVGVGRHMGVDIAREGGDRSVASLWENGRQIAYHEWGKAKLMRSFEIIEDLRYRWAPGSGPPEKRTPIPGANVHIDSVGIGAGVVDRFFEAGVSVDGVDNGSGAVDDWPELTDEVVFANRRAELHWILRRALQEGVAQIPQELNGRPNPLYTEARWPQYEFRIAGGETRLIIEPKEKIKKRHGRSPDHLDAALYAWSRSGGAIEVGSF